MGVSGHGKSSPVTRTGQLHPLALQAGNEGRLADSSPSFPWTPHPVPALSSSTQTFQAAYGAFSPAPLSPVCGSPGLPVKLPLPCSPGAEPSQAAAPWERSVLNTAWKKPITAHKPLFDKIILLKFRTHKTMTTLVSLQTKSLQIIFISKHQMSLNVNRCVWAATLWFILV